MRQKNKTNKHFYYGQFKIYNIHHAHENKSTVSNLTYFTAGTFKRKEAPEQSNNMMFAQSRSRRVNVCVHLS